jgi:hypothetical protein
VERHYIIYSRSKSCLELHLLSPTGRRLRNQTSKSMEQGSNHQTYMAFAHKWRIHMDIMG